jgi:hypothetical protein
MYQTEGSCLVGHNTVQLKVNLRFGGTYRFQFQGQSSNRVRVSITLRCYIPDIFINTSVRTSNPTKHEIETNQKVTWYYVNRLQL